MSCILGRAALLIISDLVVGCLVAWLFVCLAAFIQSLRAFRRPFLIAKLCRWVVGSKCRWVGGSRGRGGSRKRNGKEGGRKRCENEWPKGSQSRFWHPKGVLFDAWGALGGHFGHPWGDVGHPRGHFGAPGVAKVVWINRWRRFRSHFGAPGGHLGSHLGPFWHHFGNNFRYVFAPSFRTSF